MNLLLLRGEELNNNDSARILASADPKRFAHIVGILNAQQGQQLQVGIENKTQGHALVEKVTSDYIDLKLDCREPPPEPMPIKLVIALPRPKMLKRILQTIATLGVKELYLINSWKVEKSYWQSPWLEPEKIRENLILGLEQAKDTILPEVHQRKLFKPFVEDELEAVSKDTLRLVAHPGEINPCPINLKEPSTVVIGPEGGFTPYEVGKLKEQGFEGVSLGDRIMRVETAVTSILSRLYCA